jgi:DNA polymerase-3 subunit delta
MTGSGPLGLSPRDKGGVFFLHGEEEFMKEEAARALVEWHLDPGTRDFNFDPLRGSEVSVEDLASVLGTPPMMAEFRVVVLRETEALAGSPRAREVLLGAASNPPPGLALILLASIPKKSKAKLYRDLQRLSSSRGFDRKGRDELPSWLVQWVPGRHGVELTDAAARALVAGVGADLGVLDQEVGKLAGLAEEGRLTREIVERAGIRIPEVDRWDWIETVGNRRIGQALRDLPVLMQEGESGVSLVIGLASQLLRLGVVKTSGARGLEAFLPQHQKWLGRKLVPQAEMWSLEELRVALLGLRRADRLLKSTSLGEEGILEEWLMSLRVGLGAMAS